MPNAKKIELTTPNQTKPNQFGIRHSAFGIPSFGIFKFGIPLFGVLSFGIPSFGIRTSRHRSSSTEVFREKHSNAVLQIDLICIDSEMINYGIGHKKRIF
jgi:hypothetical protein